ncbi:uncharacterized protein OCT59_012449 [Rhizophagus irregularis]|uniref:uncharacterized protein n=1 Tax=Rhizophagus irregularis TaxID=588596 RepID=UPI003316B466|nr:hypothetical protein OCT59_012449 [Rhizophagus irregularis]
MNKGRRKCIAANILDEYNNLSSSTSERTYAEFTTRNQDRRFRAIAAIAPTSQELVELIDLTISLEELQDTTISLVEPQDTTIPLVELQDTTISLVEPQDTTISIDTYSDNDMYEEQQYVFLPRKKRSKTGTLRHITEVEQVADTGQNWCYWVHIGYLICV